jgi:hypothetical protein
MRTPIYWRQLSILLIPLLFLSAVPLSRGLQTPFRTIQASGIVSYGSTFPKLKGINVFFEDWWGWSNDEIDGEVADIKARGFNFVRTGILFTKFYDFATKQIDPTEWADYRQKTIYFMNALKAAGIYVSVVPIETDELMTAQNQHWYTNPDYRDMLYWYFYSFAKWCKDQGWNNILYISVWWEAYSADPWHDGIYSLQHSLLNFAEANEDWRTYCAENGYPVADLAMDGDNRIQWRPTLWHYYKWSRQRFNQITQLKVNATKEGYPEMLVGGEIGVVGDPFPADEWTPQFYLGAVEDESKYPEKVLINDLCAEPYVDVLELHCYFDDQREVIPYLEYPSTKPKVLGELGPRDYMTSGADNLDVWWGIVRPKMEVFMEQGNGFAYWAWKDYDARPLGLKEINFNPRPALDRMTNWMITLQT